LTTVKEQVASIKTLAGKGIKDVEILGPDAARPAGCVAYPVSTEAAVFLHVKGRVDLDAEIAKAQKKLEKTKSNVQKQEKILSDPAYLEKVSAAVQETDQKRLADAKLELHSFEETIKQFEQLKLE
jgi:valyl-tRNA synthetase